MAAPSVSRMAADAAFRVNCDSKRQSNGFFDAPAAKTHARSNAGANAPRLDAPHPTHQRSKDMNRYGIVMSLLLAMQLVVLRQVFII